MLPTSTRPDLLSLLTVDGAWAPWSTFSECTQTCGDGIQFRARSCLFDTDKPRGSDCTGNRIEQRNCTLDKCAGDNLSYIVCDLSFSVCDLWLYLSFIVGNLFMYFLLLCVLSECISIVLCVLSECIFLLLCVISECISLLVCVISECIFLLYCVWSVNVSLS